MKRTYCPKKPDRRNSSAYKFVKNPKKKHLKAKSETQEIKSIIKEIISEVA